MNLLERISKIAYENGKASRRIIRERDQWKEAAEALMKVAAEDGTCDEWNAAYALYHEAAGEPIGIGDHNVRERRAPSEGKDSK